MAKHQRECKILTFLNFGEKKKNYNKSYDELIPHITFTTDGSQ